MKEPTFIFFWILASVFILGLTDFSLPDSKDKREILFEECPVGSDVFLDGTWIGSIPENGTFHVSSLPEGPLLFTIKLSGKTIFEENLFPSVYSKLIRNISDLHAPLQSETPKEKTVEYSAKPEPVQHKKSSVTSTVSQSKPKLEKSSFPPENGQVLPAPNPVQPMQMDDKKVFNESPPLLLTLILALLFSILFIVGYFLFRRFNYQLASTPTETGDQVPHSVKLNSEEKSRKISSSQRDVDSSASKTEDDQLEEPEFLDELRHKEALVSKGFNQIQSPRKTKNVVVDFKDYTVEKEP